MNDISEFEGNVYIEEPSWFSPGALFVVIDDNDNKPSRIRIKILNSPDRYATASRIGIRECKKVSCINDLIKPMLIRNINND